MARIAKGRDRVLTRDEIAAETLRQFDEQGEGPPSVRALASALGVAPSAIYHHFESRAAFVQAALELVWQEAFQEFLALMPDPLREDPAEVLVEVGVVTRRVFDRHYRIAPFLAASPEASELMTGVLDVLAGMFDRLGLRGDDAGASLYAYGAFTIGSVLFSASRRVANEQLGIEGGVPAASESSRTTAPSGETRVAFDDVVGAIDPARGEELFAAALRRLVRSFSVALP